MKIAFDVDVLAKQMSITDMVHKVADWGYNIKLPTGAINTLNSLRILGLIRFTNIRCFPKNVRKNTEKP